MELEGKIWVIRDEEGRIMDDIDTDMIFHNRHLAITDMTEMGRFTFGNLEGYADFPNKVGTGDIIVAGQNFGSGSSRQQAVDCFRSLGIQALLARSYGAIYKRNAINAAFPIFGIHGMNLDGPNRENYVDSGDVLKVDTGSGVITRDGMKVGEIELPSLVQMEILDAGGLFEYGRKLD